MDTITFGTMTLQIEFCDTAALSSDDARAVHALCNAAYEEDTTGYFRDLGPGRHALGRVADVLVSHAMIVPRAMQIGDGALYHTAYVELVATHPEHQHRGYASALLLAFESEMEGHDLGALSPSDAEFYARLGWELWRGPLAVRTSTGLEASPDDESVMIRRLSRTPLPLDLDAPVSIEWRVGEVW
jgi:aminoglycoside 2'-N-acetyltransferase I